MLRCSLLSIVYTITYHNLLIYLGKHAIKLALIYLQTLYNKTLPQWTKSVFPEKLKPLAILSFMIEAYNKILQRLKTGMISVSIIY